MPLCTLGYMCLFKLECFIFSECMLRSGIAVYPRDFSNSFHLFFFSLCYSDWLIFIILYSRSFIHSSVSLSFLFMSLLIVCFYFSYQSLYFWLGLFFILSSFLSKCHCLYQLLSLIQLTFVLPVFLNSLSGKIFTCVIIFFRCCLTLSIETSFSTF